MTNPCDKCIVNAMCQKACDILERFVYNMLNPDGASAAFTYYRAATDLRRGKSRITLNGKFLRWTDED